VITCLSHASSSEVKTQVKEFLDLFSKDACGFTINTKLIMTMYKFGLSVKRRT